MRVSAFHHRTLAVLAFLALAGCAGAGPGSQAFARAEAKHPVAFASLQKPALGPKNLFDAPRRAIRTLAVTGDSLSIGLASELEKSLSGRRGLTVVKLGRVSSGLARQDFFNWDKHMEDLARRHRPDAVVVMLGANDNKRLNLSDGSVIHFGTREWDEAYKERVRRIVSIVRSHNPSATIFWMGAPVMADGALSRDLKHINALVRKVMAAGRDCHYVDTWQLFSSPDGGFAFSKPGVEDGQPLRSRDGVHLTQAGSQVLAARCLAALETRIAFDPPEASRDQADKGV